MPRAAPTPGRRVSRRSTASRVTVKQEKDEEQSSSNTTRSSSKKKTSRATPVKQPPPSISSKDMSPPATNMDSPSARVSARLAVKMKTMKEEGREMPWHSLMTNRKRSPSQSDSEASDSAEERKKRKLSQPASVKPDRTGGGASPVTKTNTSNRHPARQTRNIHTPVNEKTQTKPKSQPGSPVSHGSPPTRRKDTITFEVSPMGTGGGASPETKTNTSNRHPARQTRNIHKPVNEETQTKPKTQPGSPVSHGSPPTRGEDAITFEVSPMGSGPKSQSESALRLEAAASQSTSPVRCKTIQAKSMPATENRPVSVLNPEAHQSKTSLSRDTPHRKSVNHLISVSESSSKNSVTDIKEGPVNDVTVKKSSSTPVKSSLVSTKKPSLVSSTVEVTGVKSTAVSQITSTVKTAGSTLCEKPVPKPVVAPLSKASGSRTTILRLPTGGNVKHLPSKVISVRDLSPEMRMQLGLPREIPEAPVHARGNSVVSSAPVNVVSQKSVQGIAKSQASISALSTSSTAMTTIATAASSVEPAVSASNLSSPQREVLSDTTPATSTVTSPATAEKDHSSHQARPLSQTQPGTLLLKQPTQMSEPDAGGAGDAAVKSSRSAAFNDSLKRGLLAAAAALSPNVKKPANKTYNGVAAAVSQELLSRVGQEESRSILRIVAAKANVQVAYAKQMAFLIGSWPALELAKATLEKEIDLCVKEKLKATKESTRSTLQKPSSSPESKSSIVTTRVSATSDANTQAEERDSVGGDEELLETIDSAISGEVTEYRTQSVVDVTSSAGDSSTLNNQEDDQTVVEFKVKIQKMSLDEEEEEEEEEEEDEEELGSKEYSPDVQSQTDAEPSVGKSKQLHGGCVAVRNPELATAICDVCGFATTLMGLYKHKLRNHSKMKFECEVCLKQFGMKYDMRRHRLIHFTPAGQMTPESLKILRTHSPGAEPFPLQKLEPDYVEYSRMILEKNYDDEAQNTSCSGEQRNGKSDTGKSPSSHAKDSNGENAGIITAIEQAKTDDVSPAKKSATTNDQHERKEVDAHPTDAENGHRTDDENGEQDRENKGQESNGQLYEVMMEAIDENETEVKKEPKEPIMRPGKSLSLTSPSQACCICVRCGFKSSAHGVMKHEQRHHPAYTYPCQHCERQFGITTDLRQHMEKSHPKETIPTAAEMKKRVHCQSCKFVSSVRIVQQHIKMMHVMTTIKCLYCKAACTTITDMKEHYNQEHPEIFVGNIGLKVLPRDNESFTCNICCKMMKMSRYQSHMLAHEQQRYNCDQCDFVARWPWQVRKHKDILHNNVRPVCAICGKTFTQESSYRFHMRTKHPDDPGSNIIKCEQCDKEFTSKRFLNVHIKRIHSKEMRHFCDMCGKGFFEKIRMKEHRDTHFAEGDRAIPKRFECKWCHHRFIKQSQLSQHENIHTGNKPYKCKICGRGFSWASEVHKHMFTHSDERPYVCTQCGRGFKFRYKLKTHMITHTHNSQHVCHACGKAFTMLSTLRRHRCKSLNVDPNRHGLQTEYYISVDQAESMLEDEQQQQVMLLEQQEEVHEAVSEPLLEVNQNEADLGANQVVSYMCGVCQNLYNSVEEVNEHISLEHGMTVILEDDTAVKSEMEAEPDTDIDNPVQQSQMVVKETNGDELVLQSLPASEIQGIQHIVINEDGEQVILPSGDIAEHHQLILGDGEQLEVIEMEEADMADAQIVDAENITYITSGQVEQIVTAVSEATDEEQAIANALTSLAS